MNIEEFLHEFETAHRKYPMRVMQDSHIRHQNDDCEYCPITAVARNLINTDSPIVYGQVLDSPIVHDHVLPEDFVPEVATDWARKIGLSDEDAQYIIMASDYENLVNVHCSHWEDVYEVYVHWDAGSVKEIRKKLLAICKETTP